MPSVEPDRNTPPSLPPPLPARIKPLQVLLHIFIIQFIALIGGVMVLLGCRLAQVPTDQNLVGINSAVSTIVGFAVVGCLATGPRWLHLLLVAFGSWLTVCAFNLFIGMPFSQWSPALYAFTFLIFMGIGGAIASLLKRMFPPRLHPPPLPNPSGPPANIGS
jgi:hypothetical protein